MPDIQRYGVTPKWSDAVVHGGVAYFVEVADDPSQDVAVQVAQVLTQIDARLSLLGSNRSRLLQVMIYLADLKDAPILNEQWIAWLPAGQPPSRACVQAALSPGYAVEMVITAAVEQR